MDRYISTRAKKLRLFKKFECMHLIPYAIALILLLAELYILFQFIRMYERAGQVY